MSAPTNEKQASLGQGPKHNTPKVQCNDLITSILWAVVVQQCVRPGVMYPARAVFVWGTGAQLLVGHADPEAGHMVDPDPMVDPEVGHMVDPDPVVASSCGRWQVLCLWRHGGSCLDHLAVVVGGHHDGWRLAGWRVI